MTRPDGEGVSGRWKGRGGVKEEGVKMEVKEEAKSEAAAGETDAEMAEA